MQVIALNKMFVIVFAGAALFGCLECPYCAPDCGGHALGESWTCDDGCNTCTCTENGVASTLMACPPAGLANPASVYCVEEGGSLEIREGEAGQYGVCILPEGECEEWAFYRGECIPGSCVDKCGDGFCDEVVCMAVGCPCPETPESCPIDCA